MLRCLAVILLASAVPGRMAGQGVPCEDISLQACTESDDDCFRLEFPFRFNYDGSASPAPTSFDADEIEIKFTLVGNGVFDLDEIVANLPQNAPAYVYVNGNEKVFSYYGACQTGPHVFDFTDCQDPTIRVFVIAEPGASVTVETNVDVFYNTPTIPDCRDGDDDCDPGEITSADPGVAKDVPAACSSDFTIAFKDLPTGPVSPHEEVQMFLVFNNNSGAAVTLSELDFRLRITDVHGNLGGIALDPATANNDPPLFASVSGDEYHFFLNSFINAAVPATSGQTVLSFSVLPPAGLANLLGEVEIELISANVSLEGGPCCSLDATGAEGTVTFPGELSCDGGDLEDVEFVIGPHPTPWTLDNCEVGFVVLISSPAEWKAERLLLELETGIAGSMAIESVTPFGNLTDCGGCLSFNGNSITYDFDDDQAPINISDSDDEGFIVVLDGLNGSLESIDFIRAAIGEFEGGGACIPDIVHAQNLDLPLESACDYCSAVSVEVGEYYGSLNTCEKGFTVYLNATDGTKYDEIYVEFVIDNPDGLTLDVSSVCNNNPLACQPGGCPVSPVDNCTCYDPATGTVIYRYCDPGSGGINLGSNIPIVSVKFEGLGCIPTVVFKETTFVDLYDGDVCTPLEDSPDNPLPLCTECSDNEFMVSGNIQRENGQNVYVADDAPAQGVFIVSEEESVGSGCPDPIGVTMDTDDDLVISTNFDCWEVTEASNCTGDYNITFECEHDDEFIIMPRKNTNHINGVTTFDLVTIRRHILAIQLLDSPYKIIAADANRSETVTTTDIVEIQKLILGINQEFPFNTSWRFVVADYVFPNPLNPWSEEFPECIHVDLSSDNAAMMKDFIAIKIGDVNLSANNCVNLTDETPLDRSAPVSLTAAAPSASKKGETVSIDIWLQDPAELVSWEMGLRFDPGILRFLEALPGDLEGMSPADFGTTEAGEGKLRALWVAPFAQPVPFKDGYHAFTLRFEALQAIDDLAPALALDNAVLPGRAYRPDGIAYPFQLGFGPVREREVPAEVPMTVSALPNPFSGELRLLITLPEDDWLEVSVFDVNGRRVGNWSGETAGHSAEVIFARTADWGTGIFTYRASTARRTVSGMVTRN